MKYAGRCIAIFIVLTILLVLADVYWIGSTMPINGIILFSALISLVVTLFYGWIDAVYIKKRQPGIKK